MNDFIHLFGTYQLQESLHQHYTTDYQIAVCPPFVDIRTCQSSPINYVVSYVQTCIELFKMLTWSRDGFLYTKKETNRLFIQYNMTALLLSHVYMFLMKILPEPKVSESLYILE